MSPSVSRPHQFLRNPALLLLAALPALTGLQAGGATNTPGWQSDDLTADERKVARELAEREIGARALRATGPMYLVRAERVRDKQAEEKGAADALALVTHYRYLGDLAILTVVNLTRRSVVRTDTVPHMATPLSSEEFERARQLALADPAVARALGDRAARVIIEPLVTRTVARDDPLYAHRVVRLLFRLGADYLTEPIVYVDLTTDRVIVQRRTR